MIDFPSGATVGQTHTAGNRTWIWNGTGWERQINRGQAIGAFYGITEVQISVAALPAAIGQGFQLLNYV
ncbi:MAG: hypothetical protein AzoDbin1_04132 [Azoarcus sp.]|nr:hypothetical protein [Azoarcus sp.]